MHGEGKDSLGLHLIHHISVGNAGLTLELDICHNCRITKSISRALALRSTLDDKTDLISSPCLIVHKRVRLSGKYKSLQNDKNRTNHYNLRLHRIGIYEAGIIK